MTYIPDGSSYDYYFKNDTTIPERYSWGWLGSEVPKGSWLKLKFKEAFLACLEDIPASDFFMGYHRCELCGDPMISNGTKHFTHGNKKYACPAGVAHYITKHDYCPPLVVQEAVFSNAEARNHFKEVIEVILANLSKDSGFQQVLEQMEEDDETAMRRELLKALVDNISVP